MKKEGQKSAKTNAAHSGKRMVRRWRKKPHCGGWWEWKELGGNRVTKLLLTDTGGEVATDDEWCQSMGRWPSEDLCENYWEMSSTDQKTMPGLWRQLSLVTKVQS